MRTSAPFPKPLAALCAAVLLALGASAPGAPAATLRSCGGLTFTPQTEDGVYAIRARGVGCATARSIARGAEDRGPDGIDGKLHRYRSRGFTCNGREDATTMPVVNWRCRRDTALITFRKA